jgi:hypothetical protein
MASEYENSISQDLTTFGLNSRPAMLIEISSSRVSLSTFTVCGLFTLQEFKYSCDRLLSEAWKDNWAGSGSSFLSLRMDCRLFGLAAQKCVALRWDRDGSL